MIILFFLCYIALCNATCTVWHNIWEVYRYDTVDEAAMVLGLPDYQIIKEMNSGINVQFVSPAQQVTVPYVTPIPSPAIWTTTGCSHILHLRQAATTSVSKPDKSVTTSQPVAESVINGAATTSNPASESTSLPYGPPSTSLQSNSTPSSYKSSSNEATSITGSQHSRVGHTTNINDSVQSNPTKTVETDTHVNTATESQGTGTTPTTSRKETEAKSTSTHKQPTHPLEKTGDTSSTTDSLPSPTRICHSPDPQLYTRNETQSLYANKFCEYLGDFWQTSSNSFSMSIFLDENNNQLGYGYSVEWLLNCTSKAFPQDFQAYCSQIMRQNYIQCINGGTGGFADSNCLRLRYRPSRLYTVQSINGTAYY